MSGKRYRVLLTDEAKDMLRRLGKKYGKKTYQVLRDLIRGLAVEPEKKGIELRAPLSGFYSLHYSRFRIIYMIEDDVAKVLVVGAGFHESGSRKDVYQVIERLVKSGVIVLPKDKER